ncbi:hypothetical protein BCF59_0073 [Mycoplasmopsis mustelae]|uniref:Uncharacterized protein n=1 Tax=Mycoplasmopsis mustelae TaxID=171289 RepID=A0A4R7UDJ9_9BACT|nr:hypothetical protein [Mycoplasmopsis mustelae]TDV24126.1 hypothetical protein BCF59_0073 [Mycoplasmopsis mustelae]
MIDTQFLQKQQENQNISQIFETDDYYIKSARKEIETFIGSKLSFKFLIKDIKSLDDKKIIFLQFNSFYIVIDVETYESKEITKYEFNQSDFIDKKIFYLPFFGLVWKKAIVM